MISQSSSLGKLASVIDKVKKESESIGLRLNVSKTKYMIIGDNNDNIPLYF